MTIQKNDLELYKIDSEAMRPSYTINLMKPVTIPPKWWLGVVIVPLPN